MLQHSMSGFREHTVRIQEELHLLRIDEQRLGRGLLKALERGDLRTDGLTRVLNDGGILRIPLDEVEIYLIFGLSRQSLDTMSRLQTTDAQYHSRDYFGPLCRTYCFWDLLSVFLEEELKVDYSNSREKLENFLDEMSYVIECDENASQKLRDVMLLADSLTFDVSPNAGKKEYFNSPNQTRNPDVFAIVLRFLVFYGDYCCYRMDQFKFSQPRSSR